jgi:hypothetical protein
MELQLVSFQLAEELKKLGFDSPCLCAYAGKKNDSGIKHKGLAKEKEILNWNDTDLNYEWNSAPTLELAKMWFRIEHDIHIYSPATNKNKYISMVEKLDQDGTEMSCSPYKLYNSKELADEAGIMRGFEILKERQ